MITEYVNRESNKKRVYGVCLLNSYSVKWLSKVSSAYVMEYNIFLVQGENELADCHYGLLVNFAEILS